MGKIRFLDPACGCGNFLVVAYREMRALDLAVLERLQELGDRSSTGGLFFDAGDLPVKLEHFFGIEIEEWPAQIAATALQLVEHQANQAVELALGAGPDTLPLEKIDHIHVANALRINWADVVAPTDHLYILGNPPFIGQYTKGADQTEDMKLVWGARYDGYLDYVTGWFAKAIDLFSQSEYAGEFAFVSTNSITQGQPVPALFRPVFDAGWRIKFAHRTFAWTSEAPGAAAVHCVITGYYQAARRTAEEALFFYDHPKGEPRREPVTERINAYLIDGPSVLVEKRTRTVSADLPSVAFGTKAADGGNLIVEPDAYDRFAVDPVAVIYLHKYVSARELIHSTDRWCLWLEDLNPADLGRSHLLKSRVEDCRRWREQQVKTGDAYKLRQTPHLFRPNAARPKVPYLAIPKTSSETRAFLPTAHLQPEVIAASEVFTAPDPEGFAFAVVSSSAFVSWQKAVGGRLKSDMRFSNTLVWNTFPLPAMTDAQQMAIIVGGQAVFDARALHPERSLADHYNPLAMAPELLAAHRTLDRAVDAVFGLKSPDADTRLRTLFSSYEKLTSTETLPLRGTTRERGRSK